MLREHGSVLPVKREVLADKDSQANGATQPKALVMAVPQADGEPASLEAGAQVHDAEHLHAIRRDGIFLPHHANLAKAEGFDQFFHHRDMRNGSYKRGCQAKTLLP